MLCTFVGTKVFLGTETASRAKAGITLYTNTQGCQKKLPSNTVSVLWCPSEVKDAAERWRTLPWCNTPLWDCPFSQANMTLFQFIPVS